MTFEYIAELVFTKLDLGRVVVSVPPVPREGEIVGLAEPFKEYGDGDGGGGGGGVNTSLFHRGQRQLAWPPLLLLFHQRQTSREDGRADGQSDLDLFTPLKA